MGGDSLERIWDQLNQSIVYVTHGKMKQILDKMITLPKDKIEKLFIFMFDWHVMDGNYTLVIQMLINLLKIGYS